jgi:hypothetical protein
MVTKDEKNAKCEKYSRINSGILYKFCILLYCAQQNCANEFS